MKLFVVNVFLVISVCGGEYFEVYYPRKYDDAHPTLTLLPSVDEYHIRLNEKFVAIALNMGFEVQVLSVLKNEDNDDVNEISSIIGGVNTTIELAKKYPNVINLRISILDLLKDYESFQYSNLLCATNCYDYYTLVYTRLISDTILNYPILLKIIENEDLELDDYILICLPRNVPNLQPNLYDIDENVNLPLKIMLGDCNEEFDNSVLAMITHEPPDTDSLLPTIFYRTPYVLPEVKDRFPNSISLSTTWKPLKYAFKELLKHMNWYRVAILSDDSPYSLDFLEELVPVFKEEGIVFTDQKCSVKSCEFYSPLKLLKDSDTRIIILNVDKRNARKLVDVIDSYQMVGVTWIVRDWPFEELANVMSDTLSVTLSPTFKEEDKFYPHLSSIREGIQIIDRIYKSVSGDRETFQRVFAKEATRPTSFKTNAYIIRVRSHSSPGVVISMVIEGDQIAYNLVIKAYNPSPPPDSSQSCIVRSNNFFKPCSHEELLLLICVCAMFALSLLVVVVCFNKYRSNRFYNRFP